jgi:hypothetical protein
MALGLRVGVDVIVGVSVGVRVIRWVSVIVSVSVTEGVGANVSDGAISRLATGSDVGGTVAGGFDLSAVGVRETKTDGERCGVRTGRLTGVVKKLQPSSKPRPINAREFPSRRSIILTRFTGRKFRYIWF